MKTIGFVDYYISEWHANNYPKWIQEECELLGLNYCVKYAWAEEFVSPVDGRNTDEWCRDFGVEKCESIAELCEKSDYILVLAPSNPEKHLAYASEVLKYGKHTYIDKTFSPDYETAEAIFEIAGRYGTKFFSTSALRYAEELEGLEDCKAVITTGGGSNIEEYIVHQIEMVVKTIGAKAQAVRVEQQGAQYICSVAFENDKKATMVYSPAYGFSICAETAKGESVYKPAKSSFFGNLIADILCFYESGETSFDTQQTLEAMKIREAVVEGKNHLGEWKSI